MPRFAILSAFFILLTSYGELGAEHLFLKNGSIVECKILHETPEAYTVRVKGSLKKVYSRNEIMRVLYTKLYLGKVYIYKTDGSILEGHIVEEDQNNFTVRTDINRPAEFTIKRADVSFISRKKPAGAGSSVTRGGKAGALLSGNGFLASTGLTRYLVIAAVTGVIVPMGKFARIYDCGAGITLRLSVDSCFYPGIGVGIESGYTWLHGRTDRSQYASIVPFMASMTYRFPIRGNFVIEPRIRLGGGYHAVSRAEPAALYFKPRYTTERSVEFMFAFGAGISYRINRLVFAGMEADYTGIAETTGVMSLILIFIGAGVRL
ncbi:MAG: hypothetical protein JW807_08315 [Spirochaetes bacterium]|nr:hypothetical protein [Spirochaetota bacterium]